MEQISYNEDMIIQHENEQTPAILSKETSKTKEKRAKRIKMMNSTTTESLPTTEELQNRLRLVERRLSYYKNAWQQSEQQYTKIYCEYVSAMQKLNQLERKITEDSLLIDMIEHLRNDACLESKLPEETMGYVFLEERQVLEELYDPSRKYTAWRYTLQTPYLTAFPQTAVIQHILQDLSETVLPPCGCCYFVKESQKGALGDILDILEEERDKVETDSKWKFIKEQHDDHEKDYYLLNTSDIYVYNWILHGTLQKRYWEIDLFVTRELNLPMIFNPNAGRTRQEKEKKRTWKLFHVPQKDK